jgi:hypothetical protein
MMIYLCLFSIPCFCRCLGNAKIYATESVSSSELVGLVDSLTSDAKVD